MKKIFFYYSILIAIIFFQKAITYSQAGSLDLSFDTDGMVTTFTSTNDDDVARSTIVQPDGKIIVVGYSGYWLPDLSFNMVRLNQDGTLDPTFNGSGKFTFGFGAGYGEAYSVALQVDGKIIIAGYAKINTYKEFAVLRLNNNGMLDSTFSSDGVQTTNFGNQNASGKSVIIQNDGKIVVAGYADSANHKAVALVRYNTDGSLDNSFSDDGKITTTFDNGNAYALTVAIQTDDKIITAGNFADTITYYSDFALVRYNADGSMDNTFNIDGKVITDFSGGYDDFCWSMVIQPDGSILTTGYANLFDGDFFIAKYLNNGSLDPTFGTLGITSTDISGGTDESGAIYIQPDNKILIAGYAYVGGGLDFAITRYHTNGTIDTTFDTDGKVTTDFGSTSDMASSISIQPDLKIIVSGVTNNGVDKDYAVARYISGLYVGIIDFSADNNSILTYPNPITQEATLTYTLQNQEEISIDLINNQGQLVSNIIRNEIQEAGDHQQKIKFPTDLASGVYYLVIINKTGKVSVKLTK